MTRGKTSAFYSSLKMDRLAQRKLERFAKTILPERCVLYAMLTARSAGECITLRAIATARGPHVRHPSKSGKQCPLKLSVPIAEATETARISRNRPPMCITLTVLCVFLFLPFLKFLESTRNLRYLWRRNRLAIASHLGQMSLRPLGMVNPLLSSVSSFPFAVPLDLWPRKEASIHETFKS